VDCDFIGRALSHQFKHLHSPGVCEVLRRGSLGSEVVSVGEQLSLLPVGADISFNASNLQIGALRRLLRTLRDQFDVIIVDSGPVTASVEAIPVASSCDGAVMVIRRGRSRSRLPESVKELTDAGIDYLGLVLNYADADDCRRYGSISKMSAEVARALSGSNAPASSHPLLGDAKGG
jgi:Mrp family chromosome partitioning ATPase